MQKRPTPTRRQSPILRCLGFCLLLATLGASSLRAQAAPAPATVAPAPFEAVFAFNYVRSNAPPGGCGCFSLFGGSASAAYRTSPHFALVAEFAMVNNNNVENTDHILTLTTLLFGVRVPWPVRHTRYTPFAQALIGGSHDAGMIAQIDPSGPSGYTVFAASLGGGLDVQLTRRLSLRTAEVDYLLSNYPNHFDNRQDNTRVSSGLVVRF